MLFRQLHGKQNPILDIAWGNPSLTGSMTSNVGSDVVSPDLSKVKKQIQIRNDS